jgi:hypothetical protein
LVIALVIAAWPTAGSGDAASRDAGSVSTRSGPEHVTRAPLAQRARVALLELQVGSRPGQAAALVAALADGLRRAGLEVLAGGELGRLLDQRLGAPPPVECAASAPHLQSLRQEVREGSEEYLQGFFAQAAARLERTIDPLAMAAAACDDDGSMLAEALRQGRLYAALARLRHGSPGQTRSILRQVACSGGRRPEPAAVRREFGPLLADQYAEVVREVDAGPRASLRVEVEPPGAAVFVDGNRLGAGPVARGELCPGRHHLQLREERDARPDGPREGNRRGRVRQLTTAAGENRLRVDLGLDFALSTREVVGLVLGSRATAERQATGLVVALAAELGLSDLVLLEVGEASEARQAGQAPDSAGLRATWYHVGHLSSPSLAASGSRLATGPASASTSRPATPRVRSEAIDLPWSQATPGRVADLGHQLAALARRRLLPPGLADAGGRLAAGMGSPSLGPPWYRDAWGWTMTAVGLAVLGTSTGLYVHAYHLDEEADATFDLNRRDSLRDSAGRYRLGAHLTIGVGAALVVGGLVRLAIESRRHRR